MNGHVDISAWRPSSWYKIHSPHTVEMFGPNHTGMFTLSNPISSGNTLTEMSFTMQFITHEDYDFAGLAINNPPHKENFFGLSFRNQTFESKALALKDPFEVRLLHPYEFILRREDKSDPASAFNLTINGRQLARIQKPLTHLGIFVCEAHVRFDHMHVLLNP